MIATVLTPLKDMAVGKIVSFVLSKFYALWDTILQIGGGVGMKIITIALDTVTSMANITT